MRKFKPSALVRRGFTDSNRGNFEGLGYALFLARTEDDLEYLADEISDSMGTAWGAREYLKQIFDREKYEYTEDAALGDVFSFPEDILQMTAVEFFTQEKARYHGISSNILNRLRTALADNFNYGRVIRGDSDKKEPLTIREIVMAEWRKVKRIRHVGWHCARAIFLMLEEVGKELDPEI
jgi:hypothetical protein